MKSILTLGILAALATTSAAAENVQISGFGQVVAGTVVDGDHFPATGYDGDLSFREESLFAVQVRGDLNDQWSATAQIVARGAQDFDPEFAWAYLGWNGGNGWSAKLGRQRIPFYRYSDFLEVGFAFPWLRVPNAVYNLDFANYDGASLGYAFATGEWFTNIQTVAGSLNDDVVFGSGVTAATELENILGVAADTTYADWLTLRASYFRGEATLDIPALNPLFTGLRANGFGNVASRLDFDGDKASFWGLGAEVNHGNLVLIGEVIGVEAEDTFLSDRNEYYVTGGYRFGNVLPTLTYGRRDNDAKRDIIALLPNVAPLAPLRAGVTQTVLSEAIDDEYLSFGLRWDFRANMALKADYTRFTTNTPASADADSLAVGVVFTF